MNNYQKLKLLNIEQLATQLTKFGVALLENNIKILAESLNVELPKFSESDQIEIYDGIIEWLLQEEV